MIKLPEPAAPSRWKGDPHLYSEDQFKQVIRDALEEAATACENLRFMSDKPRHDESDCATAIRKLKEDIQ